MRKFRVTVNDTSYNVEVQEEIKSVTAVPCGQAVVPAAPTVMVSAQAAASVEIAAGDSAIKAPMPGKITKVLVKKGDTVKKGDVLMILEAMKMQNEITSPVGGCVTLMNVANGKSVKPGEVMAVIG
jgi:glutaconyl-CoA/methylmalonyl-CoA decarboxylase subunit gamma